METHILGPLTQTLFSSRKETLAMDPLPRRRKEGGGEIVEVYGFAGWIASLVAYGEQQAHLNTA